MKKDLYLKRDEDGRFVKADPYFISDYERGFKHGRHFPFFMILFTVTMSTAFSVVIVNFINHAMASKTFWHYVLSLANLR